MWLLFQLNVFFWTLTTTWYWAQGPLREWSNFICLCCSQMQCCPGWLCIKGSCKCLVGSVWLLSAIKPWGFSFVMHLSYRKSSSQINFNHTVPVRGVTAAVQPNVSYSGLMHNRPQVRLSTVTSLGKLAAVNHKATGSGASSCSCCYKTNYNMSHVTPKPWNRPITAHQKTRLHASRKVFVIINKN